MKQRFSTIYSLDFEQQFGGMGGSSRMGGFPNMSTGFPNMGGGFPNMSTGFSSGFGATQDPPIEHSLSVTLEELLHGTSKKMKITKEVLVPGTNTVRSEPKVLEISVKRGWKEGTKITFPKEGNHKPGKTPATVPMPV